MAELVLSTQDYDIVQDLQELEGRPQSPLFGMFWSELKILLESHARVDDRRHGECKFTCTRSHVLLSFAFPFSYAIRCRSALIVCEFSTQGMYASFLLQFQCVT